MQRCTAVALAAGALLLVLMVFALAPLQGSKHLRGSNAGQKWPPRWLEGMNVMYKNTFASVLHQGTDFANSLALEVGLEEEGGAPAKQVNTTASGKILVEELLSNKKLTKEVKLTPTHYGWVEAGRIFNIYMEGAHVGDTTRVYIGPDGDVRFDVEDLNVGVTCEYDLRLTSLDFAETGRVTARLKGPGMTLRFPQEGIGPGSCDFKAGLDLDSVDATSERDPLNVAIDDILQKNLGGVRSEIVQEMEDGLCRALLAPTTAVEHGPKIALPEAHSMWPLVIGTFLCLILSLAAAFFLGRCTVQRDKSKVTRALSSLDSEESFSSSDDAV